MAGLKFRMEETEGLLQMYEINGHGQPVKGYPCCSSDKDGGAGYSKLLMCITLYGAEPESSSQIPGKF
jgi:hypothetical protein